MLSVGIISAGIQSTKGKTMQKLTRTCDGLHSDTV